MSAFCQQVEKTPGLEGRCRPGLGGLKKADRDRVDCANTRALQGSVDVDAALRKHPLHSRAARWDYLVGFGDGCAPFHHWIEVHPAGSTSNAGDIGSKLDWLTQFLRADARHLATTAAGMRFVWVASGASCFNPRDRRLKSLAARGLHFAGRHYSIT